MLPVPGKSMMLTPRNQSSGCCNTAQATPSGAWVVAAANSSALSAVVLPSCPTSCMERCSPYSMNVGKAVVSSSEACNTDSSISMLSKLLLPTENAPTSDNFKGVVACKVLAASSLSGVCQSSGKQACKSARVIILDAVMVTPYF